VTVSSWLNFGRPAPPRRGVCGGAENFWLRLTTASAQCLLLSDRFFFIRGAVSENYFASAWYFQGNSASSAIPLLVQPFIKTDFSGRAFRFSTPYVWNSLPQTVLISNCLYLNLELKQFLFTQASLNQYRSDLPPAPLKLRPYGAIEIIIFYTLGIEDTEGFGEKIEENCRSDHYSRQSSNTKESCSSTPLNRCTSMEMKNCYCYYIILLSCRIDWSCIIIVVFRRQLFKTDWNASSTATRRNVPDFRAS